MDKDRYLEIFNKLQDERKEIQKTYDDLSVGEQKSQSAVYRTKIMILETGLKIASASKTDKLDAEMQKLKERLNLLENPHLKAV